MNIDRLCPGCMNDNGGDSVCSICGYDMSSQNDNNCLPVKFLLSERYFIGKAIGFGAEGITYIAWDTASNTAVHIKEYFPKDISIRNPDKTVSVITGSEFSFNEGLMNFISINKKLIATELSAIVPVLTVFEENGTVYAVKPIISGITLNSFLERNGGALRWEQARPLFLPLIDTVKELHEMGIIHGGISPETIMVGRDGKLRLTSLCIPRLRIASQDSPAELYSGYAAIEQYGKVDAKLSVATDVYALSAVLFRVIIGAVPPTAEARLAKDTLTIPARFADELPRQVLVAIANGLQIKVENRTEDIDVFKNELVYGETQENLRKASNARTAEQKAKQEKVAPQKKGSSVKYAIISAGITAAVFLIIGALLLNKYKDTLFGSGEPSYENSKNITAVESEEEEVSLPESTIVYEVPRLVPDENGNNPIYYKDLSDDKYENFKFSIKGKVYSDVCPRGAICEQSIEAGKQVKKGTTIEVTISLGPKEFELVSVVGKTRTDAKMMLLEQGFLSENIIIKYMQDSEKDFDVVIKQKPGESKKVTAESEITIYVNNYQKPIEEEPDNSEEQTEDTTGSEESLSEE